MKNSTDREATKLEAAMKANPPHIVWRNNGRGVQVAVSVDDPHAEHELRKSDKECARGHELTDDNTIFDRTGKRCRLCKQARRREWYARKKSEQVECSDPALLAAARTEI